jgi:hypothetical protein
MQRLEEEEVANYTHPQQEADSSLELFGKKKELFVVITWAGTAKIVLYGLMASTASIIIFLPRIRFFLSAQVPCISGDQVKGKPRAGALGYKFTRWVPSSGGYQSGGCIELLGYRAGG